MVQYLAKRIGRSILTLFVIVTLVFCLLRLMPVEGYFANYEKMTNRVRMERQMRFARYCTIAVHLSFLYKYR